MACPQCQRQDKYKNFSKKEFQKAKSLTEQGSGELPITIIYGAKKDNHNELPPPQTKKCADCQQEKDNLLDYQDNNKTIKICQECKQKRDNKPDNDEGEEIKKYGEDYQQLKKPQQEQRKLVIDNWEKRRPKKDYWRSKFCSYCQKEFKWNKSLKYLESEKKVQQELDSHKASCPLKNNKSEQNKIKQREWDKDRKNTNRVFTTCKKCKGKIVWNKGIKDYKQMIKQLNKELSQHDKECASKPRSQWTIKVYASPGTGSGNNNNLPDGTYNEEELLSLSEKDNEGEVYQEQESKKPTNYTPWIIGGIVVVLGVIIFLVKKKKNKI